MRRYILLQYMRGQKSDDPLSMSGTFDDLRDAIAFAGDRMQDFNKIVDSDTWAVVWRLNRGTVRT